MHANPPSWRAASTDRFAARRRALPFGRAVTLVAVLCVCAPQAGQGQWRNRYPRVQGYGHHVYLEGYELPVLANGPMDAAPSPDGRELAFAARGWIWVMDLSSRTARQLTGGRDLDSRPAWHPSGDRIAFVRDDDRDTEIVIVDARSGERTLTVDSDALDLDPVFSADGSTLHYSSGRAGTLDVWALDLATGETGPVTREAGIELRPQPVPGTDSVAILSKRGGDRVELRPASGGEGRVLAAGNIWSMTRPAVSPDGATFVLNAPSAHGGWSLTLHSLHSPEPGVRLAHGAGALLAPAWSADGRWVYYSRSDDDEVMETFRVPVSGGAPEAVRVGAWRWREGRARVRVRTTLSSVGEDGGPEASRPAAARLSVVDGSGHPAVPDVGGVHFDGTSGRVFFYTDGLVEVSVPPGSVTVAAVQGLATPETTRTTTAHAGEIVDVHLPLVPVWDARRAGWAAADHHFHLNYGGPHDLDPRDVAPRMAGEALDVSTPLLANLHNRIEDVDLWGWERSSEAPLVRFGQEIRSHFLGHVGLIEVPGLHWPWFWGPGYEVYGSDDRTNADALDFAHRHGGIGYYVHPVVVTNPFVPGSPGGVPPELIADAVLGDVDALEILCLWSSAEGTSTLWHELLNLGLTIAPTAGSDVMLNLYRTMAVGATRVYAKVGDDLNWPAYLDAFRRGRSFVTNGPFLEFEVDGVGPGGVVSSGPLPWTLDASTATEADTVELLVNGRVVSAHAGPAGPGRRRYEGRVELPSGGWVAARARGGATRWPSMDTAPFAHTAPIWIGAPGSSEPSARRAAAAKLLGSLRASHALVRAGYAGASIPRLDARFQEAIARLDALATAGPDGSP